MSVYTQQQRLLAVETPLGQDKLLIRALSGREAISQPFSYALEVLAEAGDKVPFEKLLGKKLGVRLVRDELPPRYFCGICSRVAEVGRDRSFDLYRIEIVPELWLLTRKAQSRIFQQKTVPDILRIALTGLTVVYNLRGEYQLRDYCVQYRETDFNFVSRLMEEEGIYYYFTHAADGHKLVIADNPSSFPRQPDTDRVEFEPWGQSGGRQLDRIMAWEKAQELRPGKVTLWDHCFEMPGHPLNASAKIPAHVQVGEVDHRVRVDHNDRLEIYDYPGEYAQRFDGVAPDGGDRPDDLRKIFEDNRRTATIRSQEQASTAITIRGAGHCRSLAAGHAFTLDRHHNANGNYVVTGIVHEASQTSGYRSSNGEAAADYHNSFTCIPAGLPYRPARLTPKPVVHGTQTATVVGPRGDEIFTDKYGRVKVQFHWDREGKNDAGSSCWVRVATPWAGRNWGMIHIPRIGQEVVVAFEEGDPDRPIIVGSVYNADQMPPYPLPDSAVLSGIKSDSTKGGGGYNEMVFDDTKGKELIRVHGQHDMDSTVNHDLREHVLNNRSRDVTQNETITVGGNQTESVTKNRSQTIGIDHTESIGSNKKVKVGSNQTETIGSNQTETIGSNRKSTVGLNQTETVAIASAETVGVAKALTAGVAYAVNVGAVMNTIVGVSSTEEVGVFKSVIVGSKLELKCGSARIVLESGGKVTIQGTEFVFDSSGHVQINGKPIDLN